MQDWSLFKQQKFLSKRWHEHKTAKPVLAYTQLFECRHNR